MAHSSLSTPNVMMEREILLALRLPCAVPGLFLVPCDWVILAPDTDAEGDLRFSEGELLPGLVVPWVFRLLGAEVSVNVSEGLGDPCFSGRVSVAEMEVSWLLEMLGIESSELVSMVLGVPYFSEGVSLVGLVVS